MRVVKPSGRRMALIALLAVAAGAAGGLLVFRDLSATPGEYEEARRRMVQEQLRSRRWGRPVTDERVLAAMEKVPRHLFVPLHLRHLAYEDQPLPIGEGQTISQPYIVARMTELLELRGDEKVLEVGTGSGYQAAILAELAREVYTIEILPALAERARRVLERQGYSGVHTRVGDGYRGWPEAAPFDAILVTAAPEEVPSALVEQLAEGGRMVLPVGPRGGPQTLRLLKKQGGEILESDLDTVYFVPMVEGKE